MVAVRALHAIADGARGQALPFRRVAYTMRHPNVVECMRTAPTHGDCVVERQVRRHNHKQTDLARPGIPLQDGSEVNLFVDDAIFGSSLPTAVPEVPETGDALLVSPDMRAGCPSPRTDLTGDRVSPLPLSLLGSLVVARLAVRQRLAYATTQERVEVAQRPDLLAITTRLGVRRVDLNLHPEPPTRAAVPPDVASIAGAFAHLNYTRYQEAA